MRTDCEFWISCRHRLAMDHHAKNVVPRNTKTILYNCHVIILYSRGELSGTRSEVCRKRLFEQKWEIMRLKSLDYIIIIIMCGRRMICVWF